MKLAIATIFLISTLAHAQVTGSITFEPALVKAAPQAGMSLALSSPLAKGSAAFWEARATSAPGILGGIGYNFAHIDSLSIYGDVQAGVTQSVGLIVYGLGCMLPVGKTGLWSLGGGIHGNYIAGSRGSNGSIYLTLARRIGK